MMKSNLTLKMNKDQTSSSQVAVLARILARFADLEDLNELNVANFITISSWLFIRFMESLGRASMRSCSNRTALGWFRRSCNNLYADLDMRCSMPWISSGSITWFSIKYLQDSLVDSSDEVKSKRFLILAASIKMSIEKRLMSSFE